MQQDQEKKLLFAPLQGPTAAEKILDPVQLSKMDTIIVARNGNLYRKSDAVLISLFELGGFWKWLSYTRYIIPRFLRNGVYDFVAANRYQLFGKRDTCRIPTPEEKERFLP